MSLNTFPVLRANDLDIHDEKLTPHFALSLGFGRISFEEKSERVIRRKAEAFLLSGEKSDTIHTLQPDLSSSVFGLVCLVD